MGTKNTSNALQWNANGFLYATKSGGTLKSITVTGTSGKSVKIYAQNTAYSANASGTPLYTLSLTGSAATYTFVDNYTYLCIDGAVSSTSITSIEIVWETGLGNGEESDLALTGAPVALTFDLYSKSTAQTVSFTTSSTGAVTVSGGTGYVTTSVSGKTITVTPTAVTPSPQTITVRQAADETYAAGSATFTVTVDDSAPTPTHTVTFSVNGSTTSSDVEEGAAITFPSNPEAVNGKVFVGWAAAAIDGTTNTAPTFVTSATMGNADVTYYAVFATLAASGEPVETKFQTLQYDTWTYSGTTTDKTSYRLFGSGSYVESAAFDLSKLSKVIVYGGTFGGATYNGISIGDGTTTWKTGTVSGSSQTGTNTFTDGTALTGTNKLRIAATSGNGTSNGVRISKVEIYTNEPQTSYSDYCTTVVAAAVEAPAINVTSPFNFTTTATISCETQGATIYYRYSEDGDWQAYTEPLTITATTTIYAKAVKGNDESVVASLTATKELVTTAITLNAEGITNTDVYTGTAAGTLTATVSDASGTPLNSATVTWTSSNEDVATVSEGVVTLIAAGTTTITASFAATDDYVASSQTYELTVTNSDPNVPGTVTRPYTVAEARAAIDANTGLTGVYATGIVSQVDSYNSKYNSITYWISDDGTTTNQMEVYSGKGLNNTSFSAKEDVEVGATVVVYGTLKKYNSTYEFDMNNYLTSYTAPAAPVATPTFSPEAGTYTSAQNVTITCATEGATIYYTTDGTDPTTESMPYAEPIPVNAVMTIKAIAVKDGMTNSAVATAAYIINLNPSIVVEAETPNPHSGDAGNAVIGFTKYNTNENVDQVIFYSDDAGLNTTDQPDWITNVSIDNQAGTVTLTMARNDGENAAVRTAYLRVTIGETKSAPIGVTQSVYVVDYATLPFNWAGGASADLTAQAGVTAYDLGSDYASNNAPYLVKLDGTGDYIQVKTDSQPGKVTVGVKMIGGGTSSTITVQESADGSTFTDVETLTISGSQNAVLSLETTESFAADTRYVRLLFTKGSNVGVGPITITKYVAPTPAITPESTIVNLNAALHESEIVNLTYTLIDTNTSAPTVVFCDANGEAATYDWISEVSVADDMLLFTVAANTGNGAPARMAYMKVQGTSTVDGATVSSPIITVTQAAPEYFTITLSETIANCEIYVFNNDDQGESLVNNGDQDPVSSATVLSGTTIGISFFADYGYFNPSLTVTDGDGQPVTLEGPDESEMYTFTLTSNVTIGATAVEGHTVNFFDEDIVNCTISVYTDPANPTTSALEHNDPVAHGTTVYVKVTPDDGYGTPTITVLAGDSPVEVNYANGVYSFTADYDVDITATAAVLSQSSYVLTDLADLTESDVFIIVGNNGSNYALSNDNGTTAAPTAVAVAVTDNTITTAATNILWTISGNATDGYTFYPNGSTETWLYCTATNNGVRVGTNTNKVFTLDATGYLKHTATSRYMGIYNSSDWRCYESSSTNIANQTFSFYKLGKLDPQLAFKLSDEVVTELTADITGGPFTSPTIAFAEGLDGTITYESSNPAAATVDAAGIVTLVAVGETTITASFAGNDTYNEGTASYVLTVTNPALITIDLAIVRPEGFLRTAEMGMQLGILSLSATNHTTGESVGAPASVTWSSDNPDVATVDRDGMVTAQGLPGTVTITATFAGDEVYTAASATYEITLKFEPRITEGPFDLRYGTPLTITQSADPADVESNVRSDGALTITSSETRVVTAEDNVITAQAVGQTTVTLATPETDNFWAASTDPITVSVIEPIMPATGTPTSKLTTTFSTMGYENAADITTVDAGAYTMTFEQGSNQQYAPKYYDVGTAARMYNGNTLTIASDMTITGIEFTFDGSNTTLALVDGQPGTLSDAANSQRTWTGSASSIAFTTTKTNRIKSITVTCEGDCEFAKLNANGYATYSSLYNLDFTDAEANGYSAWAVTALENVEDVITLRFAQINSRVAAGTGVLLKGTPNTTVELPIPDADGASLTQNLLDGVVVPKFVLEDNFYMLKGQTFIRTTEGVVPAHKAVLNAMHLEPFLSSGNVKAFNFVFHDTATGVETVEKLTPEQAARIFDLSGRRLNKATKGINIVNGKKILVK